jgi:predicted nucleic acid-binding protein
MRVLLHSVILIDHFNGVAAASAYLVETQGRSAVLVITRAKVLSGCEAGGGRPGEAFIAPLPNIDREAADEAAALRRAHRWKLPDAFQAALAQRHGLKLATRNERDFPPKDFEFVVVPYRV